MAVSAIPEHSGKIHGIEVSLAEPNFSSPVGVKPRFVVPTLILRTALSAVIGIIALFQRASSGVRSPTASRLTSYHEGLPIVLTKARSQLTLWRQRWRSETARGQIGYRRLPACDWTNYRGTILSRLHFLKAKSLGCIRCANFSRASSSLPACYR